MSKLYWFFFVTRIPAIRTNSILELIVNIYKGMNFSSEIGIF